MLSLSNLKFNKPFTRRKANLKVNNSLKIANTSVSVSAALNKITNQQIETIRTALRRILKKQSKVFMQVTPIYSITSKPQQVRMGKGKGSHAAWFFVVSPGSVISEFTKNHRNTVVKVNRKTKAKYPMKSALLQKT